MIYEVGPESRKVKKHSGDKSWEYEFAYTDGDDINLQWLYVSTFKQEGVQAINKYGDHFMAIAIKQAGMLATKVFCQLAELAYNLPEKI